MGKVKRGPQLVFIHQNFGQKLSCYRDKNNIHCCTDQHLWMCRSVAALLEKYNQESPILDENLCPFGSNNVSI